MCTELRVALAGLAMLGLACARPMGATCSSSNACEGDGVCLKGVCSGYSCERDDDCDEGWECGEVGGVNACALPCDADDECPGTQTCEEQGEAMYCV